MSGVSGWEGVSRWGLVAMVSIGGDDGRVVEGVASFVPSRAGSSRYRSPLAARLMASSGSGSRSSSSSVDRLGRPLVMSQTPRKVMAQPPMNLPASSPEVRSKSR